MIKQFSFGMHRQVARWETPSEDTLTQSTQLHSHQMEGTLCPALLIGQFNFGMHRYVDRWETPSKGTLPQSSQLQSPPDERHIMSGSDDRTIPCWNAQTNGTTETFLQNEMSKCKPIFVALPPIHFSSSTEHALHNAQSLFLDLSNMMEDCRDLVY